MSGVSPVQIVVDEFATVLPQFYDIGVKALAVGVGVFVLRRGWRVFKSLAHGDGVGGGGRMSKADEDAYHRMVMAENREIMRATTPAKARASEAPVVYGLKEKTVDMDAYRRRYGPK